MHREESQVCANQEKPELDLSQRLIEHLASHLRKPVEEAREDREDRAAEENVVNVRDHKVRVSHLVIERHHSQSHAVQTTDQEHANEAQGKVHRHLHIELAAQMVANQLKILTAVGIAISVVLVAKNAWAITGRPTANIWCAHTVKLKKPIATPDQATKVYPKIGLREKTGSTSEMMPKAGKIRIYTSGWPKDQKRCCQSSGSPPKPAWKKCVPAWRSIRNRTAAAVRLGRAKSSRNEVIMVIQTKSGIRLIVIPGARILKIVTTKFSEPAIDETPSIRMPRAQKSIFRPGVHITPLPHVTSVSGA